MHDKCYFYTHGNTGTTLTCGVADIVDPCETRLSVEITNCPITHDKFEIWHVDRLNLLLQRLLYIPLNYLLVQVLNIFFQEFVIVFSQIILGKLWEYQAV